MDFSRENIILACTVLSTVCAIISALSAWSSSKSKRIAKKQLIEAKQLFTNDSTITINAKQ